MNHEDTKATKKKRIFCLFLSILSLPWVLPSSGDASTERKTPVVLAVEKAGPAVVNINTEEVIQRPANPFYNGMDGFFQDFFRDFAPRFQERKRQSLGSGVIIDPRGYILTNHHVVARATAIKVSLIDKREFSATLVGADSRSDLAVVKIDAEEKLPYIDMGHSDDLMIGETVIAIGNPFGLSHTVTTGVISALERDIQAGEDKVFTDFIQLDASINPGNSGGPLLNIEGNLIGINTAIYQKAEGIGFAIPIDRAKRIVQELIQFGKVHRLWMGLFLQDMDQRVAAFFGMKPGQGVLVSKVFKGGPGEKAGINQGDILLELDGKHMKSRRFYRDVLSTAVSDKPLSLLIARDGKVLKKEAKAEKIPEERALEIALDWLGLEVEPLTKELVYRHNLQTNSGLVIQRVTPGGAAEQVGIRPGDVVVQINQAKMEKMDDYKKAITDSWGQSSILFLVQRGPYGYYVTLEP